MATVAKAALAAEAIFLWLDVGFMTADALHAEENEEIKEMCDVIIFEAATGIPTDWGVKIFGLPETRRKYKQCLKIKDQKLRNIESYKQEIRTAPFGTAFEFKFHILTPDYCPQLIDDTEDDPDYPNPDICWEVPGVVVDLGKYLGITRYADGLGGLVTAKTYERLKKEEDLRFCPEEGTTKSFYDHSQYKNPDTIPYFEGNGKTVACCPTDYKFNGVACVNKDTTFEKKTDEEKADWICKNELGTGYDFDPTSVRPEDREYNWLKAGVFSCKHIGPPQQRADAQCKSELGPEYELDPDSISLSYNEYLNGEYICKKILTPQQIAQQKCGTGYEVVYSANPPGWPADWPQNFSCHKKQDDNIEENLTDTDISYKGTANEHCKSQFGPDYELDPTSLTDPNWPNKFACIFDDKRILVEGVIDIPVEPTRPDFDIIDLYSNGNQGNGNQVLPEQGGNGGWPGNYQVLPEHGGNGGWPEKGDVNFGIIDLYRPQGNRRGIRNHRHKN